MLARTREVKLGCLFTQTRLDLYHAREHLHDLANLAARLLAGHRDDWLAARLEELDAGDVDAVLAAGRALDFTGSLAGERDKALAYFEHNAHRMRYSHFRELGMFAGSGVVEAGCKSIIGQRLKLSGMRWIVHGAVGIATLRCQDAGGRWDEIWQWPHSQTRALITSDMRAVLPTYEIGAHPTPRPDSRRPATPGPGTITEGRHASGGELPGAVAWPG